jgi:hypothetical protein
MQFYMPGCSYIRHFIAYQHQTQGGRESSHDHPVITGFFLSFKCPSPKKKIDKIYIKNILPHIISET